MSKRKRADQFSASSTEEDSSQPASQQRLEALLSCILSEIKDVKRDNRLLMETVQGMQEELQRIKSRQETPIERAPLRCTERPGNSRNLQLRIEARLSRTIYTRKHIEGENGAPIRIVLIDANTGNVFAPEATIKLDVVVLQGDFIKDNWTRKEFEKNRVRERKGQARLLDGDLQVTLEGGVGELGKLRFMSNSSHNNSKMYRIGLKVASGYCEGIRIREAISDPLRVKDQRGESYKKHYPPKPNDDVWRLEKIAKDGQYHKRLTEENIFTVEDFLRHYGRDERRLRDMFGKGMSGKKWRELIEHAETCVQSGKLYQFSYDGLTSDAVVFDIIRQLKGLIVDGSFCWADSLPYDKKDQCNAMVRMAYENWDRVREFNTAGLPIPESLSSVSPTGAFQCQQDYLGTSNGHLTDFCTPGPSGPPPGTSGLTVQGYNGTAVGGGSMINSQNANIDAAFWNQPMHTAHRVEFPDVHGTVPFIEPHSAPLIFQGCGMSSLYPHEAQGFTEIWPTTGSLQDDHDIEASMCDIDLDDFIRSPSKENPSTSRAAVLSWLKIVAAFRWGSFVRKKVTSRARPIIEQLD